MLSVTGSSEVQYQRMKEMYTGCQIVMGNLEITHMDHSRNFSFLQVGVWCSVYVPKREREKPPFSFNMNVLNSWVSEVAALSHSLTSGVGETEIMKRDMICFPCLLVHGD